MLTNLVDLCNTCVKSPLISYVSSIILNLVICKTVRSWPAVLCWCLYELLCLPDGRHFLMQLYDCLKNSSYSVIRVIGMISFEREKYM